MSWVRKGVRTSIIILAFVCMMALGAELILRIQQYVTSTREQIEVQHYFDTLIIRIHTLWLDPAPKRNPFLPPFLVFSDKNADDLERLRMIFEDTKLYSGKTISYDFLQDADRASTTAYAVTINSLGFRGEERLIQKPAHTYRIIVLGSYQAFGHGVDDDETYSTWLEKYLNTHDISRHYEVWNGGREAGTAIVGLARMQYELFKYDPDLIILDYGFIDTSVFGDNIFPRAMRLPDSPLYRAVRFALSPVVAVLDRSLLWNRIWTRYQESEESKRQGQFTHTMEKMLGLAKEQHVPVLLIRQFKPFLSTELPEIFEGTKVPIIDVENVFLNNPPQELPNDKWNTGEWANTWLHEINLQWIAARPRFFAFYPYRLNFFQLSKEGQKVLGEGLGAYIESTFLR